jgi:hypothetical protein
LDLLLSTPSHLIKYLTNIDSTTITISSIVEALHSVDMSSQPWYGYEENESGLLESAEQEAENGLGNNFTAESSTLVNQGGPYDHSANDHFSYNSILANQETMRGSDGLAFAQDARNLHVDSEHRSLTELSPAHCWLTEERDTSHTEEDFALQSNFEHGKMKNRQRPAR